MAGSGINPYGTHTTMPKAILSTTDGTSMQSTNATNTFGNSVAVPGSNTTYTVIAGQNSSTSQKGQIYLYGVTAKVAPVSQVNSIARQPITLTGFVLLPIFAALLFGFVLYRVSRVRSEREEPPEAA